MAQMHGMKILFWLTVSGLLIFGVVFVGLGGEVNRLACSRLKGNQVDCTLQRRLLNLVPVSEQQLAAVSGVELKQDCLDGCVYWVALLSEPEPVRLTRFASYNRSGVMADRQQIETFLQNNALTHFEYTSKVSWLLLLCGILLLIVAAMLIYWLRRRF